jgi:hypothetical protein
MALVPRVNSTTYVPDIQDWISYYGGKGQNQTLLEQQPTTIVTNTSEKEAVKVIKIDKGASGDIVNKPAINNGTDMADVELVSPVQGAVQQARAQYARADPIKRRTGMKRRSKKGAKRGRKKVKKRKKKCKKKGKRLKKKVHKKKLRTKRRKKPKKKRKYTKKRDIFTL